ncbi:hypothetical protein SAMN04515647_1751 [Cohaesibacter sp. ES.047]|nr:hypothetical protein SAMN04515647_1751 [Cohaesibacter sp. ES.047]
MKTSHQLLHNSNSAEEWHNLARLRHSDHILAELDIHTNPVTDYQDPTKPERREERRPQ